MTDTVVSALRPAIAATDYWSRLLMNDSIQSIPSSSDNARSIGEASDASSPAALAQQLRDSSPKQQQQLIDTLTQSAQTDALVLFLQQHSGPPTASVGRVLRDFVQATPTNLSDAELTALIDTLVPIPSDRNLSYRALRDCLLAQSFQDADRITLEKMCELAGPVAVERNWLYFSEVKKFPVTDLKTIDMLWRIFSQNRFGFSVQRDLWLGVGQNWDRLWPKIGWRDETWTRYPDGFTWSLSAPLGHLPLSNQLRGVRVMAALMSHSAWNG